MDWLLKRRQARRRAAIIDKVYRKSAVRDHLRDRGAPRYVAVRNELCIAFLGIATDEGASPAFAHQIECLP